MQFAIDNGNMDGTRMIAYTTLSHEKILEALDLTEERSRSYMEKYDAHALQYSGNGSWYEYLQDGFKVINVDVGCGCQHDCCGHPCSMSFTLHPEPDNLTEVVYDIGYNY